MLLGTTKERGCTTADKLGFVFSERILTFRDYKPRHGNQLIRLIQFCTKCCQVCSRFVCGLAQKTIWRLYWVCFKGRKSTNEESMSKLFKVCLRQLMKKARFAVDKMVIESKMIMKTYEAIDELNEKGED